MNRIRSCLCKCDPLACWLISRGTTNGTQLNEWIAFVNWIDTTGIFICVDKWITSQIAKFMGPTWGPPWSCRPQMAPMLVPWTLLAGTPWKPYWMNTMRPEQNGRHFVHDILWQDMWYYDSLNLLLSVSLTTVHHWITPLEAWLQAISLTILTKFHRATRSVYFSISQIWDIIQIDMFDIPLMIITSIPAACYEANG